MKKSIYFCVDKNKKIVSDPYWEKQYAIIHMEETHFPDNWQKLYRHGFRIIKRTVTDGKKTFEGPI